MKFINKLERKYYKYAITDLMKYFMLVWVLSTAIYNYVPYGYMMYENFGALDFGMIFKGQIWRLVTFIFKPYSIRSIVDILFFAIQVSLYLYIGRSLENAWGAFRFNLFFLSGIIFNILGGLVYYIGINLAGGFLAAYMGRYDVGMEYLFQSMFFAFAVLYPNVEVLLYCIIPIKVKYIALIDAVFLANTMFGALGAKQYYIPVGILVALINFFVFYFSSRNYKKFSPKMQKRKVTFHREVHQASAGTRHKCAVCGRTELDGENLEFRYCSKCKGNLEYCQEHLFTHEHVK
ncbi:MAG TPA: hypothetical protein DCW90_21585 [Lachnospiraceae bacterium]|nr:hypothetical protein [uncultured Lachnoclostridium sp.]HAU87970.1 hypothetical protein [Lachnospiraceae bacterium]